MNADSELQDGRTGTSQCSPYQLQIIGRGKIFTDDCDNKRHAGATQYFFVSSNKPNKDQEEVLLLELREQFYSWE